MEKKKVFEYLVVRLADWYIQQNNLKSYREFNDSNDFGKVKLMLFPFIVCTANGHREDLFSKFDYFIPTNEGNVEVDLNEYVSDYFTTRLFRTLLSPKIVLKTPTLISPDQNGEFIDDGLLGAIDVRIAQEDRKYIIGIESSLRHLIYTRQIPDLIKFSVNDLSFQHKRHSSWSVFNKLESTIFTEKYNGRIPVEFLISEKSVFAFEAENRIFA